MPVDAFPEFAPPRVEVQTLCLGLTAKEVEELINTPLEQTLTGIAGLEVIRSKAVPQLSSIELLFRPGTDLLRVRQLVQERVDGGDAVPADLGGPAGHHAGDLDDGPGDEDRDVVERP